MSLDSYMEQRLLSRQKLAAIPPKFLKARSRRVEDGWYFFGGRGVGKTHEMCGIVNSMLEAELEKTEGYKVACFVAVSRLLEDIRASYSTSDVLPNPVRVLMAGSFDVYCLDDLGAERPTEWVREQLYTLINYIYEQDRVFMVTSNLTLDELAEALGDRISSRLAEMCTVVDMGNDDRRVKP